MKNKIAYLFVLVFWLIVTTAFGQMKAIYFNAEWNSANEIDWFDKLSDVKKLRKELWPNHLDWVTFFLYNN